VLANVGTVLFGKDDVVRLALACLMASGHLLIEDLPGVGKTTLAKALARSLGLGFRRVQFTADLLPSDVLGAMVLDRAEGRLSFRPGPIFTNILLADELNRASPKAQSALLEAMEERQVSVDGTSHALPQPFMVIATQNPFDAAGTYPLPHSQRDRFLVRVSLGYPPRGAEDALLAARGSRAPADALQPVLGESVLGVVQAWNEGMHVAPEIRAYVLDLVEATRRHPDLMVGASPRAALAMVSAASALAMSRGSEYVTPDDVKAVAVPVLAHRVQLVPGAELSGSDAASVISGLLRSVRVPLPR
jgi:MoxR-like ATPase